MESSVYLISGASRGLGRDTVVAALDAGHLVVAGVRKPDALSDLEQTYGERLLVQPLDVTDDAQVEAAVAATVSTFGRIDVLVNNAGYANVASIEDVGFDDFMTQVDTNLIGVVRLTRAVLPLMRERGSGHIIQVSSIGGRMASPGLAAYQTSKWAVGGFSAVLAREVAPLGIKVTVLEPGGMRTDWAGSSMRIDPINPAYEPTVGQMVTLRESGSLGATDPAKVGRLILDLAARSEPPERLLVGPDAYQYGIALSRALLAEDEKWRELSESTVADDVSSEQLDPLGEAAKS